MGSGPSLMPAFLARGSSRLMSPERLIDQSAPVNFRKSNEPGFLRAVNMAACVTTFPRTTTVALRLVTVQKEADPISPRLTMRVRVVRLGLNSMHRKSPAPRKGQGETVSISGDGGDRNSLPDCHRHPVRSRVPDGRRGRCRPCGARIDRD